MFTYGVCSLQIQIVVEAMQLIVQYVSLVKLSIERLLLEEEVILRHQLLLELSVAYLSVLVLIQSVY